MVVHKIKNSPVTAGEFLVSHFVGGTSCRPLILGVSARGIGKNYLCERKKIEDEYKARRAKLTRADESESFREKKR